MPLPRVPNDLFEFRKMEVSTRYSIQDKLFKQKYVTDYLQEKWKAELHNRDCFIYLFEVYQTEQDPDKRHALEVKLAQFEKSIVNNQFPFPALTVDLAKYTYKKSVDNVDWD